MFWRFDASDGIKHCITWHLLMKWRWRRNLNWKRLKNIESFNCHHSSHGTHQQLFENDELHSAARIHDPYHPDPTSNGALVALAKLHCRLVGSAIWHELCFWAHTEQMQALVGAQIAGGWCGGWLKTSPSRLGSHDLSRWSLDDSNKTLHSTLHLSNLVLQKETQVLRKTSLLRLFAMTELSWMTWSLQVSSDSRQ